MVPFEQVKHSLFVGPNRSKAIIKIKILKIAPINLKSKFQHFQDVQGFMLQLLEAVSYIHARLKFLFFKGI